MRAKIDTEARRFFALEATVSLLFHDFRYVIKFAQRFVLDALCTNQRSHARARWLSRSLERGVLWALLLVTSQVVKVLWT